MLYTYQLAKARRNDVAGVNYDRIALNPSHIVSVTPGKEYTCFISTIDEAEYEVLGSLDDIAYYINEKETG